MIYFDDQNTQMFSGGQDTYIVVYDLVSDQAQYKMKGHKEQITELALFKMKNPYLKGKTQQILVSSSKDGFLKFWDLEQQSCISSFSYELMTKVSGFVMIPELKAIVIGGGSEENHLKLYQVFIDEKTYLLDVKIH